MAPRRRTLRPDDVAPRRTALHRPPPSDRPTTLDRPHPLAPDQAGLATAARVLRAGGLVAFPTETVYGLGVDAFDPDAVARVFTVKGRPTDNPLIVHLGAAAELPRVVARTTPLARDLAATFWPGPLTLVLEAAATVPAATTGGLRTVAVRVPDHPVATALLALADLPVAAPSANRSGRPSPTRAEHVAADLGVEVDVILDGGPCPVGVESTVVDARGDRPVVLREGTITREDLGLHESGSSPTTAALAASPGTRYRHYAPRCVLELASPGDGPAHAGRLAAKGVRVGLVAPAPAPADVVPIATVRDVPQLAQRLYAALRDAEDAAVEVLVVESVPDVGLGRAVMDRLRRAAGG